jgi:hypothetical protein
LPGEAQRAFLRPEESAEELFPLESKHLRQEGRVGIKVLQRETRGKSKKTVRFQFNSFHCSPLFLYLPPTFSTAFIHILISSTFTDVMFYDITDALSFSFPFPLSLSSIE